mmetsp:Transcript_66924/g.157884  ORF Transcript_66924/g.157884 Transcript_66924/m.157884 type:complete len:163 (+) Transcript_66924:45-533(+)
MECLRFACEAMKIPGDSLRWERAALNVPKQGLELLLRVHDERAVPRDGLIDSTPSKEHEAQPLRPSASGELPSCASGVHQSHLATIHRATTHFARTFVNIHEHIVQKWRDLVREGAVGSNRNVKHLYRLDRLERPACRANFSSKDTSLGSAGNPEIDNRTTI